MYLWKIDDSSFSQTQYMSNLKTCEMCGGKSRKAMKEKNLHSLNWNCNDISYYARVSVIQYLVIGQDQLTSHEVEG